MSYECKICNKQYKSYQSLWNHNKKFHKNDVILGDTLEIKSDTSVIPNDIPNDAHDNTTVNTNENKKDTLTCKYCNRHFNFRNNRWKHEKICKHKKIKEEEEEEEEKEKEKENIILQEITKQKELELQIAKENNIKLKEEAKILKLKLKLQKNNNENMTLNKINKLIENLENMQKIQININNSNVNFNVNSNNTIQNNTPIISEIDNKIELTKFLSISRMLYIANKGYGSLESLIDFIHCGKIDQFKNVVVTNVKDNRIFIFDKKSNRFIVDIKSKVLTKLINNRVTDIEIILNILISENKIDKRVIKILNNLINDINDDKKFTNDGITYENYRQFVFHKILLLLYNNRNKILTDISCYVTQKQEKINILLQESNASINTDSCIDTIDCIQSG